MRCPPDVVDDAVLVLSLLMLFAGPLLFLALAREGRVAKAIDRAIVVILVLLVLLLLVPHTIESLGGSALVFLAIGYGVPGMLESLVHRAARTMHLVTLLLALGGLLLHEMLDGAGLAASEFQAGTVLAMAIILHRFGVGLMVWLIMRPVFGSRIAWMTLVAMAVATIAGYVGSEKVLPLASVDLILAVQAVITGTIMHGLVHRSHMHALKAQNDDRG